MSKPGVDWFSFWPVRFICLILLAALIGIEVQQYYMYKLIVSLQGQLNALVTVVASLIGG